MITPVGFPAPGPQFTQAEYDQALAALDQLTAFIRWLIDCVAVDAPQANRIFLAPPPPSVANADPSLPAAGLGSQDSLSASPLPNALFIPTDLQERILAALDGKALTLDALAVRLKIERSSLHRDGIKELKARGLIDNNRRVGGYYRPDAPPPKYRDLLGVNAAETNRRRSATGSPLSLDLPASECLCSRCPIHGAQT